MAANKPKSASSFGGRQFRAVPAVAMVAMVAGAGGCGTTVAGLTTASTVADYHAANMFSPSGYSISGNADGSLRVTAAGPAGTPTDRLEKIALARAAEYGDEQHLKTFTASPAQTSFKCGRDHIPAKGEKIIVKPSDYRVVAIDVSYSTDAMDPHARPTRATADTLKAQIAADTVPPEAQASAAAEVAQQCGR